MKSDLYKVPPPKIRNIPIYELEKKIIKADEKGKRKRKRKSSEVRHERILFARASRERKKLCVNQRENE